MRGTIALLIIIMLSACAPLATPSPTLDQTPTNTPSPSPKIVNTPTASTNQTETTLDDFDPLIDSGITVTHIPPLIAKTGDTVQLDFIIDCAKPGNTRLICHPDATLFAAYGPEPKFEPETLAKEIRDSLEVWTINLPAADSNGQALQYYLEVKDEKAKVQSRYPLAGALELMVAPGDTMVNLSSEEPPLREGELILHASLGSGSEQVGLRKDGGLAPSGPSAFAIAPDGKIAVLDEVNQRVVVFATQTGETKNYPMALKGWGDIAFANDDEIIILDLVGESGTPQLYTINTTSNQVSHLGTVFVNNAADLRSDATIFDVNLGRVIHPINASGSIKSKEEQIQDDATAELLTRWQSDHRSLFTDTQAGVIFDIQSTTPLGAIAYFGKTNNGYVVIFEGEFLRILWISPTGQILDECRVANQQETPINHNGRFVINQSGSVYYLSTTPNGMEIQRVDRQ